MNISKIKKTEILSNDDDGIDRASTIIKSGGLVALPTETVYGLGADATNAKAVELIFKVKGRPAINPLIIHIDKMSVFEIAEENEIAQDLSSKFWPGPLTLILNKKNKSKYKIAKNALAGLSTIAVRVPAHPVFKNLLKKSNLPIACPSANFSGKLTLTRFEDVLSSFSGKIDAIIDGGPCPIGLESTIINIENNNLSILRPGKITEETFLENNYILKKNLIVLLKNPNNLFGHITKFNLKKEFSSMNSISGDSQIRCRKTTAFSSKDIALINIKHTYLRIQILDIPIHRSAPG